jgi:hypothetical protein
VVFMSRVNISYDLNLSNIFAPTPKQVRSALDASYDEGELLPLQPDQSQGRPFIDRPQCGSRLSLKGAFKI